MRDWLPLGASSVAKEGSPAEPGDDGRLPKSIKPVHYDIQLDTDLEKGAYFGQVDIHVEVLEDTRSIVLHSVGLDLRTVNVRQSDPWSLFPQIPVVAIQEESETITLTLLTVLGAGSKHIVHLDFLGKLTGKGSGYYRGTYVDRNGDEKHYSTSQMQPCEARKAIPCFDEPALKATFAVTLIALKELTCLSNMDVKSVTNYPSYSPGDFRKAVHFSTTPLMSTYLLALAVGDFDCIEDNSFRVPIRLYTTPDRRVEDGRYAIETTARAMALYEEKFGLEYPLPKLDLLGNNGQGGAMENWGLIIFRDLALLSSKETTSSAAKVQITETVCHEEAHLWFGDVVTMEWWEGLWLNESFATWVAWYATNHFNPKWQVWENFVSGSLQNALTLDSLRNSHPIEVPVRTTGQINQVFDAISYQKGSSVLRMIANYLGEEVFLEGVRRYIRAHAFGNTKTTDLWQGLSEASGFDIATLMAPWTTKIGYPIITVAEDPRVNIVYVQQNRYLQSGNATEDDDATLWPIFLSLKTSSGVNTKLTLLGRQGHFAVPSNDFFKINGDHTGVYRTLYTPDRLMKLALAARTGQLSVADRTGLLADSISLSVSGHQQSSLTFNVIKAFTEDTSFYVWKEVVDWFKTLQKAWQFESPDIVTALTNAHRDFISFKAHELGWNFETDENEDDVVADQFQALLFDAAGFASDHKIVDAAQAMFARYFSTSDKRCPINPNIRAAVFGIAMQYGNLREYDLLLDEFRSAGTSELRADCLRGLGHAISPSLIKRSVDLLFNESVPFQELSPLLASLSTHRAGIEAGLDVLLHRWDDLCARAPAGLGGVRRFITGLTSGLTREDQASAVEDAFAKRDTAGLDAVLRQQLEEVRVRAGWVRRSGKDVRDWLRSEGYLSRRGEE